MMKKITPELIRSLSYTDFVGLINQWNVLPGAFTTLSEWKVFSNLNTNSNILEVACTTGFSSRELALMSGCRGVGFDISKNSIDNAIYNQKKYAPGIKIKYVQADGYKFKTREKFSHIIIGASLKFFPDPERMLEKCSSLLSDGGYILASPFYTTRAIPKQLIKKAQKIFGITPTLENYKEIMSAYKQFEVVYENRKNIVPETPKELEYYCKSTTDRACVALKVRNVKTREAIFNRLYAIKEMSNKLRPYQNYSVLVLRKRANIFPRRYTELF